MSDGNPQPEARPFALTLLTSIVIGLIVFSAIYLVLADISLIGLLPLLGALVYVMARSVFWRNKTAAYTVAALGFVIGGFHFFALITTIGECVLDGGCPASMILVFSAVMLIVSFISSVIGVLSLKWGRRLKKDLPFIPAGRVWGRIIVVSVICVSFGGCVFTVLVSTSHVESGEHVDSVTWLPDEASDISYYRSYMFTAYEFDISERGFLEWAESGWKSWDIQPVTEPVTVLRYGFVTDKSPPPVVGGGDHPTEDDVIQWERDYQAWNDRRRVQIGQGYYYGSEADNGGGVYVAYDSKTGRAYFHSLAR